MLGPWSSQTHLEVVSWFVTGHDWNRVMYRFSFVFGVLAVLSSSDHMSAATFALTIRADSEDVVIGEPLFVTITARNVSDKAHRFAINGAEYHLEFYLEHRDEGFAKIQLHPDKLSSGPGTLVQPGATISASVLLSSKYSFRDGRRVSSSVFDQAGPYRLKWSKSYEVTQTMSNEFIINVVSGNQADVEGRVIYTHRKLVEWMDLRNDDAEMPLQKLNGLIERYPTSAFVDHAHMRLAEYFETKSPSQLTTTAASKDDNVWLLLEVKRWLVGRILHHYLAVSERHPKLQARAYYAAGRCVVNHWIWLPQDFNVDELLKELDERAEIADELALPTLTAPRIRTLIRQYQQQDASPRESRQ